MQYAYSDIIDRARPVHDGDVFSRRHPRMARQNRAKQYAPFAALTGFEREIKAREVLYEPRRALSAEEAGRLNAALNALYALTRTGPLARRNEVSVRVTCFEPCADPHSDAFGRLGLYRTCTGTVRAVDPVNRLLRIGDRIIDFKNLYRIEQLKVGS